MAVTPRTRFKVLHRDGFRCQYCGRSGADVVLHVDHIIPRAEGGSDDEGNLQAACRECNIGKRTDRVTGADGPGDPLRKLSVALADLYVVANWIYMGLPLTKARREQFDRAYLAADVALLNLTDLPEDHPMYAMVQSHKEYLTRRPAVFNAD